MCVSNASLARFNPSRLKVTNDQITKSLNIKILHAEKLTRKVEIFFYMLFIKVVMNLLNENAVLVAQPYFML